jgi:hypothetical protein
MVAGNSGDFVEAVFRPEIFRIFSSEFLPESTENCLEKIQTISGVFLQDPDVEIIDLGT